MNSLADRQFLPYLDESGDISPDLVGKIGVYAIFDRDRTLQYVGISRDIASSLRLHIVRVPDRCYWLKIETVTKPSRTILGEIQESWLQGSDITPEQQELWDQPLNCRKFMTDAEKYDLSQATNESEEEKVLKNLARRIEKEILEHLAARGVKFEVRFNPKRKNEGILDVK